MTMDKNVNVKTFSLQSTFIYIKKILNHTDFYLKKKMTAKAGVWQLPWGCCCHAAYHKQIKTYLFMSLCGN